MRYGRISWMIAALLVMASAGLAAAGEAESRIPISFTLDQPGDVTLVVEDGDGVRVRNLFGGAHFDAGQHTIYWDGYGPGRPVNVKGSRYDIERRPVNPGTYYVRGLVTQGIQMHYRMSVQSPGTPPWHTEDGSGSWLADHTPPTDVLYLPKGSPYGKEPQLLVSAHIAEAGHALMWLNTSGRKLYGKQMGWDGGLALAKDIGPNPDQAVHAYSVSVRSNQIRLYTLRTDSTHQMIFRGKPQTTQGNGEWRHAGISLAVYNKVAAISIAPDDKLLFIDTTTGEQFATAALKTPRGLSAEPDGNLSVITQGQLRRYQCQWKTGILGDGATVIGDHLDDPNQLTRDSEGRFYISDWGNSHQVKVFDENGKFLRAIGKAGGFQLGLYDEQRMHWPGGMAVTPNGELWVAEVDYLPKRISRWQTDGQFIRAYYGPPSYGNGGRLDPRDRNRLYYGGSSGLVEFELDWGKRTAKPRAILWREGMIPAETGLKTGPPTQVIYVDGQRYFTNFFHNSARMAGASVVGIWRMQPNDTIRLVAVIGTHSFNEGHRWTRLDEEDTKATWPKDARRNDLFYAWSDVNFDGRLQPQEVQYIQLDGSYHNYMWVQPNLSIVHFSNRIIAPPSITPDGVTVYNLEQMKSLDFMMMPKAKQKEIMAGSIAATFPTSDGWWIKRTGPILGWKNGKLMWTYHSQAFMRGHEKVADHPGEILAACRVPGYPIKPPQGDAGYVWACNGDLGSMYLLTSDGLFIAELGGDRRTTPLWRMKECKPDMLIEGVSFNDEHFYPSLTQMENDGRIYLQAGKEHASLLELTGWQNIRRLPRWSINVTPEMLADLPEKTIEPVEEPEIKQNAAVPTTGDAPAVDGNLEEWQGTDWLTIDASRDITGAFRVTADTLYAAWRTNQPDLLNNTAPDGWQYAFATGGGLDLMVRTSEATKDQKKSRASKWLRYNVASQGDVRIFVTRLNDPRTGKTLALRMEQVAAGGPKNEMVYDSPIGEAHFDSVTDISDQIKLAGKDGNFELAVPLSVLGMNAKPGAETIGDIGVLMGNGRETWARFYWSDKGAGIVSDLPSEARLVPHNWGVLKFIRAN